MHKGDILENAIRQSGVPITVIANSLSKSRMWLYNTFKNKDVSIDVFLKVGKIIHHDFSDEIKELKKYNSQLPEFIEKNAVEFKNSEFWKNKYLILLEKHNEILTELKITKTKKK